MRRGNRAAADFFPVLGHRVGGHSAGEDIEGLGRKLGQRAALQPEILHQHFGRRVRYPFREQHGAILREAALVKDEQELGTVGLKSKRCRYDRAAAPSQDYPFQLTIIGQQ